MVILTRFQKNLNAWKGNWEEEINNVLCVIRKTPKICIPGTLLGLVYDIEVVGLVEIAIISHRVQ